MIKSFRDKDTEKIFNRISVRRFRMIEKTALRKLVMLDSAVNLETLHQPPGNHFEALHGRREGQYSIRINQQYRICFSWSETGAEQVEIVDYH